MLLLPFQWQTFASVLQRPHYAHKKAIAAALLVNSSNVYLPLPEQDVDGADASCFSALAVIFQMTSELKNWKPEALRGLCGFSEMAIF